MTAVRHMYSRSPAAINPAGKATVHAGGLAGTMPCNESDRGTSLTGMQLIRFAWYSNHQVQLRNACHRRTWRTEDEIPRVSTSTCVGQ